MTALAQASFDLVVIGGGINGTGIARDAAGRGLYVGLFEKGDLAGATSSASSKLIHGGLRYLEHYEFGLVREALGEREILLRAAPHLVTPLRFVMPHVDGMRPRWMLRAGLLLYDHLAKRDALPSSRAVRFSKDRSGPYLKSQFTRGYSYWDCWVDDARLVIANAQGAAQSSAKIYTQSEVTAFRQSENHPGKWRVEIEYDGNKYDVLARVVVNASGPWVDQVAGRRGYSAAATLAPHRNKIRLVKGSHLVISRKCHDGNGFILQARDGRVVFVLPFENDYTLIGTTDVAFDDDLVTAQCSKDEQSYLLSVANSFLAAHLTDADVIHTFSGVRPLYDDAADDPSKVTRDYRLDWDVATNGSALLTVLGGKITTYRRLSEDAVDRISEVFPHLRQGSWTAGKPLPGGAISSDFYAFSESLFGRFPNLDRDILAGLARRHGSGVHDVLSGATKMDDLGQIILPGLCEREVAYFRDKEWARTAEDVLWRRTKFGLRVSDKSRVEVFDAISRVLIS